MKGSRQIGGTKNRALSGHKLGHRGAHERDAERRLKYTFVTSTVSVLVS